MSLATDLLTEELQADLAKRAKIDGELTRLKSEVFALEQLADRLSARIAATQRQIQEIGGVVPVTAPAAQQPGGTVQNPPVAQGAPAEPPAPLPVREAYQHQRIDPYGTEVVLGDQMGHPGIPLPVGKIQPTTPPMITRDMTYVDESGQVQEGV
jgi:hypothetical protein